MGYTFVDDSVNSNIVLLCEEGDFLGVNDDEDDDVSRQSDRIPSFPVSSPSSSSRQSDETVRTMVQRESELLPKSDYLERLRSGRLDLSVRRGALDWISKAHSHYSFGPMCICLATNYLDRFLSVYGLPRGSAWSVQLLAVACLSLAAKMDETKVPLSVDLQVGDPKFVFEAKTIQRMELLVLTTLSWRMRSFTPFSFVDHFLRKIIVDDSLLPSMSSIFRSAQLILGTIRGIDFLEFRPSEIAASVAISVAVEIKSVDIDTAISSFIHVQKERVLKCLELMKDLSLIGWCRTDSGRSFSWSLPQSPVGVLEAAISSYNNNIIVVNNVDSSNSSSSNTSITIPTPTTTTSTMSSIASATSSHPNKKRKTDGFYLI